MKNIYVIATAAAEDMKSENVLWSALEENGWAVRDIYDLSRLERNDITVARPEIAVLVKNRYRSSQKKAILIDLETAPDVLCERTDITPRVEKSIETCRVVCSDFADANFPGDDLESASILISKYIERQEVSAYSSITLHSLES